mgnify:CR=1 FL=1
MSQLPLFRSEDLSFQLLQTKWKQQLDVILGIPILSGRQITGINLINGVVAVNHLLGRKMQGFIQTNRDAPAAYYRSAPFNDKTLELTSNIIAVIDLWVY